MPLATFRAAGAGSTAYPSQALGASASISLITSTAVGRPLEMARSKAERNSPGFVTRIPSAPMLSAIVAKLTWEKCHVSPCFFDGFLP